VNWSAVVKHSNSVTPHQHDDTDIASSHVSTYKTLFWIPNYRKAYKWSKLVIP